MNKGFIQIRRGLEDHLDAGRLSLFEAGVYLLIHFQANYETGIWVGSAPKILATAPRGTDLRNVQRAIERLREIGFLKVFHTHGRRGNYRALINRYEPQFGALKGMRLNADQSTSWQSPVYEPCGEGALKTRPTRAENDAEDAPIPKEEVKKEERKTLSAKPTPPADARFGPFLEFAKTSFEAKHKHPPTWDCFGKDGSALAAFLRRAPHVTLELWQAHVLNFFDSTEAFTLKQGGSLAYFVSRFDTFSTGPILEGGNNGIRNNAAAVKAEPGKYAAVRPIRATA
jgi:hypothetical protein